VNDTTVQRALLSELMLHCTYARLEEPRNAVIRSEGEVGDASYDDRCAIRVAIPLGAMQEITARCGRMGITVPDHHGK
jgi:hypothetical protein